LVPGDAAERGGVRELESTTRIDIRHASRRLSEDQRQRD
jgi:hypothetical protein